jgi:hydrogenase expression/formation protein HypC
MCLSIPSKVVKIDKESRTATVDTMGITRIASLDLMAKGDVRVGDFVLLHIGFVMNKIDEKEALLSLETYKHIIESMEEEDRRQAILDGDNCENRNLS